MCAWCRYTRGRFECTHGVFNVPHHTARTHHHHNDIHTRPTGRAIIVIVIENRRREKEPTRDRERQRETEKDEKIERREEREDERGDGFSFEKCLRTSNPPDELAQNVEKKSLSDELLLLFLRKFRILPYFQLFT